MSERSTKLNVELLAKPQDPMLTVALAGRLCYSASDISSLKESAEPVKNSFAKKLLSSGHLSPVEHISFTFGVEGVSRALLAQVTRHRIASFSVQSQRYVEQNDFQYVVPPSIAALGEEAEKEYQNQMEQIHSFYLGWMQKGIPAEDARFVLPNAAETRIVFTMNARELMHFFSLRCCNRAQWEIRALAWAMLGMVRREAPALFNGVGSSCIGGACPEGRMSCGEMWEINELSERLTAFIQTNPDDRSIVDWVIANIK